MNIDSVTLAKNWPGKKNDSTEHPAIWHMLDVATCAECLIQGHRAFSMCSNNERRALIILAALHDVGKISLSFRELIRNGSKSGYRHWMLSDLLLTSVLDPIIEKHFGGERYARCELYAATSGHHGGPKRTNDRGIIRRQRHCIGSEAEQAAKDWLLLLLKLLPDGSLHDLTQSVARQISWSLSGLTIVADWVASNPNWFPPASPTIDPLDYLAKSRLQAKCAVYKAGLHNGAAPTQRDACSITGLKSLHPMQKAIEKVVLPDGPTLVVIEDATGSGKTESALILAHRMISSCHGRGVFFALPTMATANAMFERMIKAVSRLFDNETPSVSLSHGQSGLSNRFRELIGATDDDTPEAGCAKWLADDRRRSMLAGVGVGTIDQALMSILPTRFATLRLFGLTDRILVVDEAHAYDPYMQRQLETLLRMQAFQKGSAIVMTATLPKSMRDAYINAFRGGLGYEAETMLSDVYPSLTVVSSKVKVQSIKPAPAAYRRINVRRIESEETAVNYLLECSEEGATCVWVRNAVDEAIAAVKQLRGRGCKAQILHARFTYGDRLRHEQLVMERFGKDGVNREGQVLVATQVVEASLDLDFDVMVTDLAPIGSLIQRSGRLWRHMDIRSSKDRPVDGPTLTVLSPDPDSVLDDRWLNDVLGRGAFVYRIDYQWKTARVLFSKGVIEVPTGLRPLIEAVHGTNSETLPEQFTSKFYEWESAALAEAAQAQLNVIDPASGYLSGTGSRVWSDEKYPTRLGQEEATLVIAKLVEGRLVPWCEVDTPTWAWALSEVRCNRRRLPVEIPDQAKGIVAEIKQKWPKGKRDHLILCPVRGDGTICEGLRYDPKWGLLFV